MTRDVLTKGFLFSESVWNGGCFIVKKSGKGFKYTCLERASCLSGIGMVNYLSSMKCSMSKNGPINKEKVTFKKK